MKYENGEFVATVAELRALTRYASGDETRQALASIWFDAERARAAATDGHRLLVINAAMVAPSSDSGEWLVNARALAAALKGLGGKKVSVTVKPNCKTVALCAGDVTASLAIVDAVFPPIDQVIPGEEQYQPAKCVGFNANYLADVRVLGDIAEALGERGERAAGVKLRLGGELEPARFDRDFLEGGNATIVVMPMRI